MSNHRLVGSKGCALGGSRAEPWLASFPGSPGAGNGHEVFAEGGGGEVIERLGVSFRTGGRAVARRTINERRPPCRHYVSG
jgi:hypothetical protein